MQLAQSGLSVACRRGLRDDDEVRVALGITGPERERALQIAADEVVAENAANSLDVVAQNGVEFRERCEHEGSITGE